VTTGEKGARLRKTIPEAYEKCKSTRETLSIFSAFLTRCSNSFCLARARVARLAMMSVTLCGRDDGELFMTLLMTLS